MIKAVLFDLDGVLINSEAVNIAAGVRAFAEMGIRLPKSEQKKIIGRHPADYGKVFKYRFDKKKVVELHHKYYNKWYGRSKPFPYARWLVLKLKNKCKLALVTSAEKSIARRALRILGLRGVFDCVVAFEDEKARKPAPDAYLLAAKLLRVRPSECVVVEDSTVGVEAAKSAGMKCLAVTHSFPASKLKKADMVVSRLNDKRVKSLLGL